MSENRQSSHKDGSGIININSGSTLTTKGFSNFEIICIFITMGSFVLDLSTDIMLAADYWRKDHLVWSLSTFLLILIPAIWIQLFSMRWHLMDESVSLWHWIAHLCLVGVLHRYVILLKMIFDHRKSRSNIDVQKVFIQHSDVCVLHLFESFLEAAPQFILQSYIMNAMNHWNILTVLSAVASLSSLYWGIVGYMRALRKAREGNGDSERNGRMLSMTLQITWRCAMLAARLAALFMFAVTFKHWIFLFLSVHWFVMMIWIVYQKTDFCPSQSEEILYNCIVAVIYCFCFFNLRIGHARYRMIIFYSIIVSQNIFCLLLFLFVGPNALRKDIAIATSSIIICGTFLGIASMLIYYRWLHPSGPLKWWTNNQSQANLEAPADNSNIEPSNLSTLKSPNARTLKSAWQNAVEVPQNRTDPSSPTIDTPQLDTDYTDKKHLLDHCVGHAGSPTLASISLDIDGNIDNANITGIEFYSITNSPDKSNMNLTDIASPAHELANENTIKKNKRRGICSPTELGVKFTKSKRSVPTRDNIVEAKDTAEMTAQKRRGICSSGQLKDDLINSTRFGDNLDSVSNDSGDIENSNGKTSSESFNLDLDLSFSDINSSDINEFNENIVQKLCLSTLKNIKNVHQDADIRNIQKIALEILKDLYSKGGIKDEQDLESELSSSLGRDLETPSEALSAHDYENICAVNIAREAWGLRSWRACSDMGGSPPPPPPPPIPQRRPLPPSPHQHYIRTVAYELAKCEETNCQLMKNTEYHKEVEPVFLAKPYVVDPNDGLFAITPLEPILEELDDVIDNSGTMRRRQRHGSESALVATIDEIRNDTVTDSPRNVYHRGNWDSPCMNFGNENHYKDIINIKKPSSLRKSLWNEVNSKHEQNLSTENNSRSNNRNIETKKRVTISENPCIINDVILGPSKIPTNALSDREINPKLTRHYVNTISSNNPPFHVKKKMKAPTKEAIPKNLELNQVKENLTVIREPDIISGSLQNLIEKDLQSSVNTKVIGENASRGTGKHRNSSNRPRRKFSLLREKFEPKSGHSDEEMLFQSLESVRSLSQNDLENASSQSCLKNNIILINQELKTKCDKENLTPKTKIPHPANNGVILSLTPCGLVEDSAVGIKDKSAVFLKQVLNPPKINNWSRRNINEFVN